MVVLTEGQEELHLRQALDQVAAVSATDPSAALAVMVAEARYMLADVYSGRLTLIIGVGLVLTALAGWVTSKLISRIDRAMAVLMTSASASAAGSMASPSSRAA